MCPGSLTRGPLVGRAQEFLETNPVAELANAAVYHFVGIPDIVDTFINGIGHLYASTWDVLETFGSYIDQDAETHQEMANLGAILEGFEGGFYRHYLYDGAVAFHYDPPDGGEKRRGIAADSSGASNIVITSFFATRFARRRMCVL